MMALTLPSSFIVLTLNARIFEGPHGREGEQDRRWAVGQLGSWAVGQLGSWAVGQLGSWAVGQLGRQGVNGHAANKPAACVPLCSVVSLSRQFQ